jgi:hypothetical protein
MDANGKPQTEGIRGGGNSFYRNLPKFLRQSRFIHLSEDYSDIF